MKNRTGVDIVSIPRIEKAMEKPTFSARVFTEKEIIYCKSKSKPYQSFAGIYAAKEAIGKALGRGITLAFHEIEIDHDENGAPFYNLSGKMQTLCKSTSLSLSHDGEYAIAFCILEEK